jgi:hypothetical protein
MDITNQICNIVRQAETDYKAGNTTISRYVTFDLKDNIETIEAYLNSKHTSGETDSLGRDKPFFNIVTASTNIWYRATDVDRKNIKIKATNKSNYITSFLANAKLSEFMKRSYFGSYLNDWGRVLARYGSAITKFVEKDGQLYVNTIPWNRVIIDAIDINNGPVIEVLEYTPDQLRKNKAYDQQMVKSLIQSLTTRKDTDGTPKDNKPNFVRCYEVHGEFPLSYLTGKEEDEDTYTQQMHVISFSATEKDGDYNDFSLYSGKEAKNPYLIAHLIKEDGRSQGIGAVEHLFNAQWMVNHSAKLIKDQLDLASKIVFQTSDGNYVGQNALSSIENGDIMIHAINQPLTQMNNGSHDIGSLQSFANQWKALGQEITSTPDSLMGNTAPSGTAWRQVEALQNEAHSLFELMVENKRLAIEEMMREFIIPFIKTQLDTTEEVATVFSENDMAKIDSMYITNTSIRNSNKELFDKVLNLQPGQTVTPQDQKASLQQNQAQLATDLNATGSTRFLSPSDISSKTWKDAFKDFEWEVEVVEKEESDVDSVLATLTTVLQTIASNPQVTSNPTFSTVFNKILNLTGAISPLELPQTTS